MKRIDIDTMLCYYNEQAETYAVRIKNDTLYLLGTRFTDIRTPIKLENGMDLITIEGLNGLKKATSESCLETLKNIPGQTIPELLNLVKFYKRHNHSDKNDYEIFVLNDEELSYIIDSLRDGDYVFIIANR